MAQQIDIVANLLMKVDGAEAGINKLKNSLSKLKMPEGLENSFKKSFANLDVIFARYRSQVEKGFNTKADITNFAKTGKALDAELDRISKHFTELTGKQINFKVNSTEITKTEQELTKLIAQRNELAKNSIKFEISGAKEGYKDIESLLTKLKEVAGNTKTGQYAGDALDFLKRGDLQSALSLLDKASVSCKRLNKDKQDLFSDTGLDMSTAIKKIVDELTGAEGKFGNVNTEVTKLESILADLRTGQIKDAGELAQRLADEMLNTGTAAKQANGAMQDFAQSSFSAAQQLQQLQQSTQYFFSLRNMINLLKRGIREAVDVVKELDAAMTETAVVTNFSVGDMWKKLPEYTANANALGASVKDMYEATTLYYQQGLDTAAAMGIANETMKMARIGALDAKDATDKMTAALRGFNMELNETSAQRVNDVYSNLAAKTASDTKELGTAMQRTASIAASAGMSFEGTAAFLAQAIETTREPAENLGTAMKTIVARFTELKKNPLEITEVDGEEVDYNKVDTALKSIGVSLKDTNGQFRNLDQVFLDISERWDSLTQTQQRYIATTAAGSRQQSRFIAMMSNYERTMQLMDYANNSTGASSEQFGKTMESLEAKINKLKNAWNEFLMNIMNDSWTKGIVDGTTKVLNLITSLIDKLSFGQKGLKSVLSLVTAFTGLKLAGRGVNALIGGLGGLIDPSVGFGKGFKGGAVGANNAINNAQAHAISNPIVQAIHQLQTAMTGKTVIGNNTSPNNNNNSTNGALFKQVNQGIREALSSNKLTGSGLMGQLSGLDKSSQRLMMSNLNGTQRNINQNLLGQYSNSLFATSMPAIKQAFKNIDRQVANESISFVEGYGAKISPQQLLKHLDINNTDDKALIESISRQMKLKVDDALTKAVQARAAAQGRTLEDNELKGEVRAYRRTEEGKNTARQAIQNMGLNDPNLIRTPMQEAMDNLGKFGSGLTGVGLSISTFGNVLMSTGIPGVQQFGAALTKIGSIAISLGTMLSGAVMAVTAFTEVVAESAVAQKVVGFIKNPITIAVTAVAAALMALAAIIKLHNKKIKEEAEEVTTSYNEKTSKAKENIANLKQYREELSRLSKGVDKNGMNVSLDTSDYERYREIVNSIAEINPNIVQGYNAQGDAIIDNNTALEETLRLQEQINQQATDEYTNSRSLDKLIEARDLDEAFYNKAAAKNGQDSDPAREAAKHLVRVLKNSKVQDEFLEQFGLTYDELARDENGAIARFITNHDTIMKALQNRYRATGRELSESLIEGFGNLSDAYDAQQEALQPLYDNLLTYANSNNLTSGFSAEMAMAFNQGLKTIVSSKGSKGKDMQQAATKLSKLMKDITGKGSEYSKLLKDINDKQKEWSHSLDDDTYRQSISDSVKGLEDLAEQQREAARTSENLTEAERQARYAMADFFDNQAAKALDFTSKSLQDLSSNFNQFSDSVKEAAKAYDNFEERMKDIQNYDEGIKSYKQIYDKIFEETEDSNGVKHQRLIEGVGQPEFWVAAESFFTSDFLDGASVQQVVDKLKEIGPALEEGEAGAIAFADQLKKSLETDTTFANRFGEYFSVNKDGSIKIAEDIPQEIMHDLANYWDILDEVLIAQFDNIRQFVPEFTFASSNEEIRVALAADSRTIAGPGTQKTDENAPLITTKDVLVDAFHESNVWNPEVIADRIDELATEQQVYTLPELHVDKETGELQLTNEDRNFLTEQVGVDSSNFIDTLAPLIPDESTLETYASEFFQDNGKWWEETGSELYENWSNNQTELINDLTPQEGDELPTIASSVSNIESMMTSDLYRSGDMRDTSSLDQMHRAIFGDEGWDTTIQQLKHGADNPNLTKEQFEQYYADATEAERILNETLEDLNVGRMSAIATYGEYSEQVALYDEKIKQVNEDLKYVQGAKTDADEYSQTKTWNYDDPTIQQHVDDVVSAGWGNLLSNISAETLATPEAQQAMETLASHTFDPDMIPTEELTSALDTLGVEWKDAALSGMDAWHTEDIANTITDAITEGGSVIADNLQQGVDNTVEEINNVEVPEIQTPNIGSAVGQGADVVSNIAQSVTVDTSDSDAKLTETQSKATEVASIINQGATFVIDVVGASDLNSAADSAKTISSGAGTQTVGVTTSFDSSAVISGTNTIKSMTADITVGADTKNATTAAESARSIIDGLKATIDVTTSVTGQEVDVYVTKHVKSVPGGYTGLSNKISYHHVPQAGSLAGGTKKGRIGPRNQGGMTLTGELGYEIAWLPGQNKSIILGANGPQMINLPKDATVYNHEQSKEIMKKRKGIPAGSMWGGGTLQTSTSGGYTSYTGGKGSTSKTITNAAHKITSSATSAAAKVGKVSVWWENIARKTETTQRKADTAYSNFQRFVKSMQATLKTTGTKGQGNAYIKNMTKVLGYQQAQYNKADKELKRLDKSKATTKIKYGKNNKKKKDIALGNYIKYDKESGTYVIDQKKISKVAKDKKRGKAEAKAIKEAAEKKINERLNKRNKAEDAIKKAKEALDKFGEELYETFFAWENELTKIWNLTQKITQAESNISRIKAIQETIDKQIATGLLEVNDAFRQEALSNFELELQESMDKINGYKELISEQQAAVNRALSITDEKTTLDAIQKKLAATGKNKLNETERAGYEAYAQNLQERITAQTAAHKYLNVTTNADGTLKIDFDTEAFEADKLKGLYTEDAAKAIQDYVKELVESSEDLNKDYVDLNNEVNNMYDSLSSLQDAWAGYADELWDISEAETKKEVDNLKKLSDSISNSLKNLLDEVKNKLDERRKREDNAKTERDITQKQQRLAALRADTSGGHQVEIAQLEKEIADAQQDYQRTLEDQLLDKLQQQADLAEKQRERQIELQEQIASEINNAEQVDKWMAILSNPEATEADKDAAIQEMWEAFKTANDYDKKPLALQESLEHQFNAMVGGMMTNQEKQAILTNSIDTLNETIQAIKQSIEGMQQATSSRSFKQLEDLGFNYSEIRKAGFGLQDFLDNGVTDAKDLRKAGFSASTLFNNGYTLDQLRKAGYSASTLQDIVNKDPNDAAKQKGLGGMKAGKVDINGSKKGGTVKDSHLSSGGTRIGANSGSTLYHADWNEKEGKAGDKWTEVTVDKLTPKLMETYPVDAKQALEYAIKHRKPGDKINANMKELIQAAKKAGQTMAGNSYKLSNGYNARLGGDGTIHYSGTKDKKDGVYVWNPSTGKLSFRQYDKKKFTDWAKSSNVGSEYKYVLHKKGVKGYATGGLADFTGPAWLDGTPSKPELILSAKDTQNFIALKDILANAMSGMGDTSNTYGDILYEININVDKIEKDYDVDRVVKKVKEEITKGAGYRNVTQVRNFR